MSDYKARLKAIADAVAKNDADLDDLRAECPHADLGQKIVCDARQYVWCNDCGKSLSNIEWGPGSGLKPFDEAALDALRKRSIEYREKHKS